MIRPGELVHEAPELLRRLRNTVAALLHRAVSAHVRPARLDHERQPQLVERRVRFVLVAGGKPARRGKPVGVRRCERRRFVEAELR
jgi:hypothetical protein